MPGAGKRAYHSPKRQERAAETRRKVLEAAADVFDELGYAGTRMAMIAERAGVSVESVHGVGSKGFLLVEAFKLRYAGEAEWDSIFESGRAAEILSIDDPVKGLDAWMEFQASANRAAAGLWAAVCAAVPAEPTVARLHEELWESRRRTFEGTVRWMIDIGIIDRSTPDDAVPSLAARVSTLTSFETYDQLVEHWGWPSDDYETWLRQALTSLSS